MENNKYEDYPVINDAVINSLAKAYSQAITQTAPVTPSKHTLPVMRSQPIHIPHSQTERLLKQILEELREIRTQMERQRRMRLS